MPRPILATIHTAALRANLQALRLRAGDARVWAVVKANAYGHGIERVFDGLHAADGFALLDLAESQRLRALGWRGPILLLEGNRIENSILIDSITLSNFFTIHNVYNFNNCPNSKENWANKWNKKQRSSNKKPSPKTYF